MSNDETCIFCKIIKGEIPAHTVYEDEKVFAFLDVHPEAPGHTLLIPKAHVRWVWDLPLKDNNVKHDSIGQKDKAKDTSIKDNVLYSDSGTLPTVGYIFSVAKKIADAQKHIFETGWVISKIIGDEVPHAHIHLFPGGEANVKKDDFETYASRLSTHTKEALDQ